MLLSDIDGLYTSDPHKNPDAKKISVVEKLTPEIMELGEGKGSNLGTGGMKTKLRAAKIATQSGIDMVIADGSNPMALYAIINGEEIGTRFIGEK